MAFLQCLGNHYFRSFVSWILYFLYMWKKICSTEKVSQQTLMGKQTDKGSQEDRYALKSNFSAQMSILGILRSR